MDVYYHVKFQLCIISGSKVSRGVQNCTPPGIGCVQKFHGIGLRLSSTCRLFKYDPLFTIDCKDLPTTWGFAFINYLRIFQHTYVKRKKRKVKLKSFVQNTSIEIVYFKTSFSPTWHGLFMYVKVIGGGKITPPPCLKP